MVVIAVTMRGRSGALLERDRELSQLEELVSSAGSARSRLVVVQGEAGIGKTALLAGADELASINGTGVLKARGGELEREFAYGVVRQLFERRLARARPRERSALLAGPAGSAAAVVGWEGLAPKGGAPDVEFVVQQGLFTILSSMARTSPVLVVVDDAQWADAASLRWLLFLTRRLEDVRGCVLVAWRSGEPGADEGLLQRLRDEPAAVTLEPSPLSAPASAMLVRSRLGRRAGAELCRICHEQTGGNPLLLVELSEALGSEPESNVDRVELARRLGPATVGHSVLLRLSRLPPGAAALAEAVAVLDTDAELRHVAAMARLDAAAAGEHAAALAAARILRPEAPLRFVHPLLRSAVYTQIAPWRRSAAHRRAAEVLAGDGALERGAAHLMLVEPQGDPRVVALLMESASRALGRGAADVAAGQFARALREPPPARQRAAVLLALGRAERLASLPGAAPHLREALDLSAQAHQRAYAGAELTTAMLADGDAPGALEVACDLAERLSEEDEAAAMEMEAEAAAIAQISGRLRARMAPRLAELERRVTGDLAAGRRVLVTLAFGHLSSADAGAATIAELLDRAARSGSVFEDEESWAHLSPAIPLAIAAELGIERVDAAWAHATRLLEGGRELGSAILVLTGAGFRARIGYMRGEISRAERDARIAASAAEAIAPTFYADFPVSQLVLVLVESGRVDEALRVMELHGLADERLPRRLFAPQIVLEARLAAWLASGRVHAAVRDAELLSRMGQGRGTSALLVARSLPVLALHAGGAGEHARELALREVDAAMEFGLAGPLGSALHALALIETGAAAVSLLERAVAALEGSPRGLDFVRAIIDFGAALRRSGQRAAAVEPLRRGLELAAAGGATVLAQRARSELALCGLRPRRAARSGADALTAAERRVAEMVAAGNGNVEVASALFVARRTVETHLSSIYRKLGISRRDQLAAALAAEAEADMAQR